MVVMENVVAALVYTLQSEIVLRLIIILSETQTVQIVSETGFLVLKWLTQNFMYEDEILLLERYLTI